MAGDICNTNAYEADDKATHATVRAMFEEQIAWAVDERADFLIAETIDWCGEAEIALDVTKRAGLPAVVTLSLRPPGRRRTHFRRDGPCKRLEAAGADAVGLNCQRGPKTLMPIVKRVREAVACHVAALPVPSVSSPGLTNSELVSDVIQECRHFTWRPKVSYALRRGHFGDELPVSGRHVSMAARYDLVA